MGIREDALALADELEAFEDCDCEECSLYCQPECKGHLSCMEVMARYAARKMREAVERDGECATTVSAHDLLSDEDRKAIAWVREHGGLGPVEKRLIPEGMEWPRYTDGSAVEIGDEVVGPDYGERIHVDAVKFHAKGFTFYDKNGFDKWYEDDDRFERSEPKVLDADGEPLEVGQTVYGTRDLEPVEIVSLRSKEYDGVRTVKCKDRTGFVFYAPDDLTHQRPVLDADGVPCREGDEVWEVRSHRRREIVGTNYCDHRTGEPLILCDGDDAIPIPATFVTHTNPEQPDTYAKLYEDVHDERCGSEEFVRRCKELARKENNNE